MCTVSLSILRHYKKLKTFRATSFFLYLHGPFGEGGPLQELLEYSGKTFVGSSSGVAATAMDKEATKQFAIELGIQTPHWCQVSKRFVAFISIHPSCLNPSTMDQVSILLFA